MKGRRILNYFEVSDQEFRIIILYYTIDNFTFISRVFGLSFNRDDVT